MFSTADFTDDRRGTTYTGTTPRTLLLLPRPRLNTLFLTVEKIKKNTFAPSPSISRRRLAAGRGPLTATDRGGRVRDDRTVLPPRRRRSATVSAVYNATEKVVGGGGGGGGDDGVRPAVGRSLRFTAANHFGEISRAECFFPPLPGHPRHPPLAPAPSPQRAAVAAAAAARQNRNRDGVDSRPWACGGRERGVALTVVAAAACACCVRERKAPPV